MSRIVVWSPNFAPEVLGIPPLVTDACEWLAGRGHAVDVITAYPNYPDRRITRDYRGSLRRKERWGDIAVHRSWLRVRNGERFLDKALYELTFTMFSAPALIQRARRADVVVCVVPCLSAAAASALVRRASARDLRLVLWIQDLVLQAATSLNGLGHAARWSLARARALERVALQNADSVVVCSPAFTQYAIRAGAAPDDVKLVYNWVDLQRIRAEPTIARSSSTRFLYAGNLGYTQGFETLIAAAQLVGPQVEVDIVGAGNSEADVKTLAATTANVRVRPPVSDDQYPELLASADAHVVMQRRLCSNANFPSKIASYLASGRPVVGSISPRSAAASVLNESGGAIVVAPESPEALAEAMRRLHASSELRHQLGVNGRAYAEHHFDRIRTLERFEAVLLGASANGDDSVGARSDDDSVSARSEYDAAQDWPRNSIGTFR